MHLQPRHWHVLYLLPHCESTLLQPLPSAALSTHLYVPPGCLGAEGDDAASSSGRLVSPPNQHMHTLRQLHKTMMTMAIVRLAEIFTAMMTCCSPAEVKASRQESRRRQELTPQLPSSNIEVHVQCSKSLWQQAGSCG